MSRKGVTTGACRQDGANNTSMATQPFPPQFYPVAGYQGNPHAWFPLHPSTAVPSQWSPSWRPPMGYPTPTPLWPAHHTPSTTNATPAVAPASDEYTVDTLRRIYKDDDGRVEIQRVKVQRRQPESGGVSLREDEPLSVVPVGAIPRNERRPPPRKHRKKQEELHIAGMGPVGAYPWYPYMPYPMSYPYPYPYYLGGCMWPPGAPSDSVSTWSGNEQSQAVSSHQDSVINSQRLESRTSHFSGESLSAALHRSSSPAAASHITESHSLAPSDSVSVRGHKRQSSFERALLGPTPPPRTKSRASSTMECKSDHAGKTQEWMMEMQRALRTRSDVATKVDDNDTSRSDHIEVYKKIPPIRKRRKMKAPDMSDQSSMTGLQDMDDVSEQQSIFSDDTFDESSRLSSELSYAFRKLERSVDAFKTEITAESSLLESDSAPSPSVDISHSSGEATPTEAHLTPLPFSDIRGLAKKAKEEGTEKGKTYGRPRATSESVCSLPSLEMARVGSAPDVSVPVISSSQLTTSTETSPVTVTPTTAFSPCPAAPPFTSSTAQVIASHTEIGSTKPMESTSDTKVLKEAPVKLASSGDTAQICDTNDNHLGQTARNLAGQPSPPPNSYQPQETNEQNHTTTTETKTRIAKETTQHDNAPAVETVGLLSSEHTKVSDAVTCVATAAPPPPPPPTTGLEGMGGASGRHSQASTATTFFSVRTADESHTLDTDSTDIPLVTSDSADENEEGPGSLGPKEDPTWVLQRPEEAPTLNTTGQHEHRNAWRAEVSLWRASLVVSLCGGRGLDRQDWNTFHLMVHHPLTLDLKLSLLHATRLCAANSNVGPAVLRMALIQLAGHGEVLLQPESSRQPGWRCIRRDASQPWTTLKGAAEILHSMGYEEARNGLEVRYKQRYTPEASVVARLTLDLLVLAEEFRLFLTGTHQYPNNVSSLFFPGSVDTSTISDQPQRPASSEGSFVSAQSEVVTIARPQSEASSVTDEDTQTLQTCATHTNSHSKLTTNRSTSEEDVTLREDDNGMVAADVATVSAENKTLKTDPSSQVSSDIIVNTSGKGQEISVPDSTSVTSEVVTSVPDMQPMTCESQPPIGSEVSVSKETFNPTTTLTQTLEVNHSSCKAEETNAMTKPVTTCAAAKDNPEEHVYEEIDVIRAQVQSLRASSVPTESVPPPLPPKQKISGGGEDESQVNLTYPHLNRSSASTPASLRGGSMGTRRKKRRAPMPPEFLPLNWKESQETTTKEHLEESVPKQECTELNAENKVEYRRSLNPFYEEIDSLEDSVKEMDTSKNAHHEDTPENITEEGNPFLENKVKAKGYIGKNPFYEDVEILKKSEEYKEIKTKQPLSTAPMEELATGQLDAISDQHSETPTAVRPKRRAPHPPPPPPPPPTSEVLDACITRRTQESTSPQHGDDNLVAGNVFQADGNSDNNDQACKQVPPTRSDHSDTESSLLASSNVVRNSEAQMEAELRTKSALNKDTNTKTLENKSLAPVLPGHHQQHQGVEAAPLMTPKQSITTRPSLSHPNVPPPPLPVLSTISANSPSTEDSVKPLKEESPPPIPPPKAPLTLLDEIPYMDANEIKEARAQTQSPDTHCHDVTTSTSPISTLKFNHTLPRQSSLTLVGIGVNQADLPPHCLPPLPPCSPPESPPSTPHTSPPDTPHVSPPETPHTSPPETPHTSPPSTPSVSPKHTPLPPSRHRPQNSFITTKKSVKHEKTGFNTKTEDEPPPVPPKSSQVDILDEKDGTVPHPPSIPPKSSQQEETPHPPRPPKPSLTTHIPVTTTDSTQSSTSEERYEIPDTSRAPPPRPPIPIPLKTQQHHQQHHQHHQQQQHANGKTSSCPADDRYEVPEPPKYSVTGVSKASVEVVKAPQIEERYEIPELVKDQHLQRGVSGAPSTAAGVGRRSLSSNRGEIAAIFGPSKPPRRRRNNNFPPPPRPPKNPSLVDATRPNGLNEPTTLRAASITISFTTTTSSSSSSSSSLAARPAFLHHKKTPKQRSWPLLLCDCLYVNCCTYKDADK